MCFNNLVYYFLFQKHKLKTDINALELLLAGNPHNKVYKKDLEDYRAKYKKLTNKSPVSL
jgi:translation initiation factor 2 beta subunit (eIF-2beta)/eIF-5